MDDNTKKTLVDEELMDAAEAGPEDRTVAGDPLVDPDAPDTSHRIIDGSEPENSEQAEDLRELLQQKEDRFVRLYAEFENYKRRNQRERLQLIDQAGSKTLKALLPVLDDFDRAAQTATQDDSTKKVWDSGVGLIVNKLYRTLATQGLKPMESTGEDFNADLHEAVTEIPAPDQKGKVVDTIERGYTLNGKILRHAKVVVGK